MRGALFGTCPLIFGWTMPKKTRRAVRVPSLAVPLGRLEPAALKGAHIRRRETGEIDCPCARNCNILWICPGSGAPHILFTQRRQRKRTFHPTKFAMCKVWNGGLAAASFPSSRSLPCPLKPKEYVQASVDVTWELG